MLLILKLLPSCVTYLLLVSLRTHAIGLIILAEIPFAVLE